MKLLEKIRKEIMSWPMVEEKPNRFGSKNSYFVNCTEFCHFHSDRQMDIMKTKNSADKRIEINPYSLKWVMFNFKTEKDASDAIELCKRAYSKVKNNA